MDRKGQKLSGSGFIKTTKESDSETLTSKQSSLASLKLQSIHGSKQTKAKVDTKEPTTATKSKKGKESKNVSLVSIRSRRSVGFNVAKVKNLGKDHCKEKEMAGKNVRSKLPLLPPTLKGRFGKSYNLVDNRRSFGPEYHPDIPKKRKTVSKINPKKTVSGNKSTVSHSKRNTACSVDTTTTLVNDKSRNKPLIKQSSVSKSKLQAKEDIASSVTTSTTQDLTKPLINQTFSKSKTLQAKENIANSPNKITTPVKKNSTKSLIKQNSVNECTLTAKENIANSPNKITTPVKKNSTKSLIKQTSVKLNECPLTAKENIVSSPNNQNSGKPLKKQNPKSLSSLKIPLSVNRAEKPRKSNLSDATIPVKRNHGSTEETSIQSSKVSPKSKKASSPKSSNGVNDRKARYPTGVTGKSKTKPLTCSEIGSVSSVQGRSQIPKSRSDKTKISRDLRKPNEFCVADQDQICPFVEPSVEARLEAGLGAKPETGKAVELGTGNNSPEPRKGTDSKQVRSGEKISAVCAETTLYVKVETATCNIQVNEGTACLTSIKNLCGVTENARGCGGDSSEVSQNVDLPLINDTGEPENLNEESLSQQKVDLADLNTANACGVAIPVGRAENCGEAQKEEVSGSLSMSCRQPARRDCSLQDDVQFTKQASHTLSRKFTWFKDGRSDEADIKPREKSPEIEEATGNANAYIDNNNSNISFSFTHRRSKLSRQRKQSKNTSGRGLGKSPRAVESFVNGTSCSSPPRTAAPVTFDVKNTQVDNTVGAGGSGVSLSASNTCSSQLTTHTGPGITGGTSNFKDKEGILCLKKQPKIRPDNFRQELRAKDSLTVSHGPPGEIPCHSQGPDLNSAENLSDSIQSISGHISNRVDWSNVDFSPYYYNSSDTDSPPKTSAGPCNRSFITAGERHRENYYGQTGTALPSASEEDSKDPRETGTGTSKEDIGPDINRCKLYSICTSVRCITGDESTYANHLGSAATTRRHSCDELVNTNKFITESARNSAEQVSPAYSSPASSPKSASRWLSSRDITCTDDGVQTEGLAKGKNDTTPGRLEVGRLKVLSPKCDPQDDVKSTVKWVRTGYHRLNTESGYDSFGATGVNDVNEANLDENKHSGDDSDILAGNLQLANRNTGRSDSNTNTERRTCNASSERSRQINHATGIRDKSGTHVSGDNEDRHADRLGENNAKNASIINSVSTTTEQCFECGKCLPAQPDQDQVRYLFYSTSEDVCPSPLVDYASSIPLSQNGPVITDTEKALANMTDNKSKLTSPRQAGEKVRGGSESQGAVTGKSVVGAKNRSPSTRASPRSAEKGHNNQAVPHGRAPHGHAEAAPVTCKCRERAVEIKLSKLKNINNACKNNCSAGHERPGSRSRSQSATSASSRDSDCRQQRKSSANSTTSGLGGFGVKRHDSAMDARQAPKLGARAGTSNKEVSLRANKLTQKSERSDIGVQDKTMSKQSAVEPGDGQNRAKIIRPRSGGHNPDTRTKASKEGCSADRSEASGASSRGKRKPHSPRERSAEPSKDTLAVKTKVSAARNDKTDSAAANKQTGRITYTPRSEQHLVKPTGKKTTGVTATRKLSPRSHHSDNITEAGTSHQHHNLSKSSADCQKTSPRYCSGSTVSSRNKSVRSGKVSTPRETAVESNPKRDQRGNDSASSGKSYSSRKSIPGPPNSKINSAKPSRIINKSKCSKHATAVKSKTEDAVPEFGSRDLSPDTATEEEIQNSNSNCDSESDAAIKTRDKLAVIETAGDRVKAEEREKSAEGRSSDSESVYSEVLVDSKDFEDKGDGVFESGSINNSVDADSEVLIHSEGTGLSCQGRPTNCEARYRRPATTTTQGKNLKQKIPQKVRGPNSKVGGTSSTVSNATRQSRSLHSKTNDDVGQAVKSSDVVGLYSGSINAVSAESKYVGKRKPDAMKTGRVLSDSCNLASSKVQVASAKSATFSGTSGQCSGIPKLSHSQGATHGTSTYGYHSSTPVIAEDKQYTEASLENSGTVPIPFEEPEECSTLSTLNSESPSSSLAVTLGYNRANKNATEISPPNLDGERLRSDSRIFPIVGDKKRAHISPQVKVTGPIQRTHCEVSVKSTSDLNEGNNAPCDEDRAREMPPERNNKITITQKSLSKHGTTDGLSTERFSGEEQLWVENNHSKQCHQAKSGSVVVEGGSPLTSPHLTVDTHLLDGVSANVTVCGSPVAKQGSFVGECVGKINEKCTCVEKEKNEGTGIDKTLQTNTIDTQENHSCRDALRDTMAHAQKSSTSESVLHIRLGNGKQVESAYSPAETETADVISTGSELSSGTSPNTPAKVHSVSISCLNWNLKNSCFEEKPRVPTEVAVVSGPKVERSSICFLPTTHTKLVPTTVKADHNLSNVVKVNIPQVPVDGTEAHIVPRVSGLNHETSSSQIRHDDLNDQSGKQSDSLVKNCQVNAIQIQCPLRTLNSAQNTKPDSETDSSYVESEMFAKTVEIKPTHSKPSLGSHKAKTVRKIPVFTGHTSTSGELNKKSSNPPDVVIHCTGNGSVEVEISKSKNKSARRVQAKRMAYDVDYSGKKKQGNEERLGKEKSKSISDLRHESNTVIVEVKNNKSNSKRRNASRDSQQTCANLKQTAAQINPESREMSKSTPDLIVSTQGVQVSQSQKLNPFKNKNFKKSQMYSGLVKKIAVLNAPVKNRCKSNPDIALDLAVLDSVGDNIDVGSAVPLKSPRPKTTTVKKIKAKKVAIEGKRYQSLSKQKSKSTPDLRDIMGGHKSPIDAGNVLQKDVICSSLVKNNQNKANIMKFSANFYTDLSTSLDDGGKEISMHSEKINVNTIIDNADQLQRNCDSKLHASEKPKTKKVNAQVKKYNVDEDNKSFLVKNSENCLTKSKSQIPCAASQFKILTSSKVFNHLRSECTRNKNKSEISSVHVDMTEIALNHEAASTGSDCSVFSSKTDCSTEPVINDSEVRCLQVNDEVTRDSPQLSEFTFDPICSSTGKFEPFDVDISKQVRLEENNTYYAVDEEKQSTVFPWSMDEEAFKNSTKNFPYVDEDFVQSTGMCLNSNETKPGDVDIEFMSKTDDDTICKRAGPKVLPKTKKRNNNVESKLVSEVGQSDTEKCLQSEEKTLFLDDGFYKECSEPPASEPEMQLYERSPDAETDNLEDNKFYSNERETKPEDDIDMYYDSQTTISSDQKTKTQPIPQSSARVSGRYTEAQLRKIRSDGKSLLEKRSRVPKGLVEDTVNVLATHLEGLLQGSVIGNQGNTQQQEPMHGKGACSGESKVNFLKKRFEADQSTQDLRKQRALERSKGKNKKLARPMSMQITGSESQQTLDIGTGRHALVMSTSTDSCVSRDSGFINDPDCMIIELSRPSELRERPVSLTDSDMTCGSEVLYQDCLVFDNRDEDLGIPYPGNSSSGVEPGSLSQVNTGDMEDKSDLNANDIVLSTTTADGVDALPLCNDVNSNYVCNGEASVGLCDQVPSCESQDLDTSAFQKKARSVSLHESDLSEKFKEILPVPDNMNFEQQQDICVYNVQTAEFSVDPNANFIDSNVRVKVLPDLPVSRVRLSVSESESENLTPDSQNTLAPLQDSDVKMRPKTKQKPKQKFNRISSTISIFEGKNNEDKKERLSTAADVNSCTCTSVNSESICEFSKQISQMVMSETDKNDGFVAKEAQDCLYEGHFSHIEEQLSLCEDIDKYRKFPSGEIAVESNSLNGSKEPEPFQSPGTHALEQHFKCFNVKQGSNDGQETIKLQNFGQNPGDSGVCLQADFDLANTQIMKDISTSSAACSDNSSEVLLEENYVQDGRSVQRGKQLLQTVHNLDRSRSRERNQANQEDKERCLAGQDMDSESNEGEEVTQSCKEIPNQFQQPCASELEAVCEAQAKPRRYKSPARESHSFSTPPRYQTREARAQSREARAQQRLSRSRSSESPRRNPSEHSRGSPSPARQSRSQFRNKPTSIKDSAHPQSGKPPSPWEQWHKTESDNQHSGQCSQEMSSNDCDRAYDHVPQGEHVEFRSSMPQPNFRKSHSFSEELPHSRPNHSQRIDQVPSIKVHHSHSISPPARTKEPPLVPKKPKHQVKRQQSPTRKPHISVKPKKSSDKNNAGQLIRSESPSRELKALSPNKTPQPHPALVKSQSMVDKTPTIPRITLERDYQSSTLPRSGERDQRNNTAKPSLKGSESSLKRGRLVKRMKSPVRDIFPNKLSVSVMDHTKTLMSPERREAEKLYAKALAELSYDQGEEDDAEKTLIATSENSSLPFYSPSNIQVSGGSDSPRTRLRRSLSLPTPEFGKSPEIVGYADDSETHTPRVVVDDDLGHDESGEPAMGRTPFFTPEWSPDMSSVLKRRNLSVTQNDDYFTPARPSSYQNAMATTLLTPGDDPWSPFSGPIHHIVLPRQQSMVDIPFNCPEAYIDDDDEESQKYHTIGRCQSTLMAECPRLQRNASFYAAQKKSAIPLHLSNSSDVSSPIIEEHGSGYCDDDVFTSSGSSDRSFEKIKEPKSPGIIKRMLRRHRSFNDRDKERKDFANTSGSKDQSFFKFPALKSILRRGSKDLIKLAKDSDSIASDHGDAEQAPLAKFQRDSDIESVPGSPYASNRRLRRSLTAGELMGFRTEKRASLAEQLPIKYNTFMCSDDDNDNDNVSIHSLNASPIHSPTPCPPIPSRQKPYSRSSSFSVHFTDQSHTEEYSDSDKLPSTGDPVSKEKLRNDFLHRDVTSSNSNDSGIQNDSSAHSSSESLKGQQPAQVVRREMAKRQQERPRSDCSVRWAHNLDTSAEEVCIDTSSRPIRRPRNHRTNSDLGDLTTLTMAVQQFNQLTKMPHSISMKNIRRKKFIEGECGGKSRRMSTPHPIKNRQEKARPDSSKRATLHRSLSMPVNLDKLRRRKRITSFFGFDSSGNYCSPDHYSDDSSDESENSMDISLKDKCHSTRASHIALSSISEKPYEECLTYAEALWDHVTMDPEELGFRAGDVIEVTDTADKDWWWGAVEDREGWFPAAFVRLRANQGQMEEDDVFPQPIESMERAFPSPEPSRRLTSTGGVSREQARTNVINEILQAEKDYVKHLHDVIEGYIHQARRHPGMFSEHRIRILFGNLEEIYNVSQKFVTDLEKSYNSSLPHLTEVGQCFLNSKKDFEIYSDYCNNHPDACKELQELYRNKQYRHFFEACRLLQEMIQIPLEGFLLTPVQKICKYPLQLSELLKFTDPDHSDYNNVCHALEAMKRIACLINERKRKMESIAKISAWQLTVEDWEGADLLEMSSELITSGEAHKINRSGRSQERTLFLFDHQLVYCKKDLLRKNGFCYKGRVSLDQCDIIVLPDGKDLQYNVNVKNGWKLHDRSQDKWFLFYSKTAGERERWLRAFSQERRQVQEDQDNEFTIPRQVQTAILKSRAQLEKPKGKPLGRRMSTAGYYQKDLLRNLPATLPRNIGHLKKKSWFNFMGKKTKT